MGEVVLGEVGAEGSWFVGRKTPSLNNTVLFQTKAHGKFNEAQLFKGKSLQNTARLHGVDSAHSQAVIKANEDSPEPRSGQAV